MPTKGTRATKDEDDSPQSPLPQGQGDVPGSGWVPVPDPTKLTTDQLRRELNALRELLETRLTASDTATALRITGAANVPTLIDEKVRHLRELENEKLRGFVALMDEKLRGLEARDAALKELTEVRFTGNRELMDERAVAAKEALAAALQAAKELVTAAQDNTTKLLDQITELIRTSGEAADARMVEIKERIDRGEGGASGAANQRTETRLNTGQLIALIAAALLAVSLFISGAAVVITIVLHK